MNKIFPGAEVRQHTIWQRFERWVGRRLHHLGIHSDVWTYRIGVDLADGFEERPLTFGVDARIYKPEAAVIVKQLECLICERRNGPIYVVEAV